ncbi:MAG: hypothetical protein M0009_01450 [Deltaproteobacteria bacterium]|nr:hypothetical protein [Deltaproteobacteria bacterium]
MKESEKQTVTEPPPVLPAAENRWCERHGYVIDVDACRARAEQRSHCRRCLARWQQLPLPFPEPF